MKRARTVEEMRFAASLEPCPKCGTRQLGSIAPTGAGHAWSLRGNCPACGTPRVFEFVTIGDPTRTRIGAHDLGPLRSELLAPDQLLAVLDESLGRVPPTPANLEPDLRAVATEQLRVATTCLVELLKLVPLTGDRIPDTSDTRLTRTWLSNEHKRLRVLAAKYTPPPSIGADALAAHAAYSKRGAKGDGQIKLAGASLARQIYGAADLSFVEIERSDLAFADFAEARFEFAALDDDTFDFASLRAASLVNARIRGGSFRSINGISAKFDDAEIARTTFARSDLAGSLWYGVRASDVTFDGARFGSAVLDRATFTGCRFVEASFAKLTEAPLPTSAGAQFVDCDLTNTDWTGRDLSGTTFLRCKLAGAGGVPSATARLVVTDCDIGHDAMIAQLQEPLN